MHSREIGVNDEVNSGNYCPHCGEQLTALGGFCQKCGRRLRPTPPKTRLLIAGLGILLFGLIVPNLFFKFLFFPIGFILSIVGMVRHRKSSTSKLDGICSNCRRSLSDLVVDSSFCAYCGTSFSTIPPALKAKTLTTFRILRAFGILLLLPLVLIVFFSIPDLLSLPLMFGLILPYLLAAIYFLRAKTCRASLAIPLLLFSSIEFIGLPLPLPLLRRTFPTSPIAPYYIWGVTMLKKMWTWYPLEGIVPLFVKLVLITASVILFMATTIHKTRIKGPRRIILKGVGLTLTFLPLAYVVLAPIPPPELGYAMQPCFGTGGPGPRLDIQLGDCTLTQNAGGKYVYRIPVEYRFVVGPPHGPGDIPLVINKIQFDEMAYTPPFDLAKVEGKGLEVREKGIVIQPYANGTIIITVDEPHSWLIIYGLWDTFLC